MPPPGVGAAARADALPRLLAYLARVWTEPGGADSLEVACVSGAVLDLTGRSPSSELKLESRLAAGCRLEFAVLRRPLMDKNTEAMVADVAAGKVSPWLLPWAALMHDGDKSAIIAKWRVTAEKRLTDKIDRGDLGSLTLLFATHAKRRPAWDQGLKGWNMETSPYLDEIRAVSRDEGREEGREGATKALLLRLGRQKFGKPPSKRQQKILEAITDLSQLEALADRLLTVDSWPELLTNGSE
jgi:hypothetical protein